MGEILRYKQQGNHTKGLLFTFKQNIENKIVQKCKYSILNSKFKEKVFHWQIIFTYSELNQIHLIPFHLRSLGLKTNSA